MTHLMLHVNLENKMKSVTASALILQIVKWGALSCNCTSVRADQKLKPQWTERNSRNRSNLSLQYRKSSQTVFHAISVVAKSGIEAHTWKPFMKRFPEPYKRTLSGKRAVAWRSLSKKSVVAGRASTFSPKSGRNSNHKLPDIILSCAFP